jgi:multisite-specific tRNA:(cytosine-C5)-methyltransferase
MCCIAQCSGSKRAASPSLETAQEAKKVRTEGETEDATVPSAAMSAVPTPEATPAPEADEQKMGGGRPFNEDPYSYLPEDDDQVQTCM